MAIEEATTYELSACYNVSIECHSGDMVANILTSTLFDGKIYAKGSPETCMEDINGQLKFSITFGYNDIAYMDNSSKHPFREQLIEKNVYCVMFNE